jgi:hypothetical protein
MFALVYLAQVPKMPIVKRICQHTRYACARVGLFARRLFAAYFALLGLYAIGIQKVGDFVQSFISASV